MTGHSENIKGVILAAGKGTRMRELTEALPKPMLKVQGKPILEHILEGLIQAGIRDLCIITGWRADVIESYFGNGDRWNARIEYARQDVQDGTGKAPELAKTFVGSDPFLLTYGDILVVPKTYQDMLARFREDAFAGLLTVTVGEDVSKGAINLFDDQFCLKRIIEKPTAAEVSALKDSGALREGDPVWYNAGIYMFRPVLFEHTARLKKSVRGEFELPDAINTLLEDGHRVAGCRIAGRWVDVRDPEVLSQMESDGL